MHVRIVQKSGDVGFAIDARAADSGPTWLVMTDVADGTPIMVCGDGRGAVYDLAREALRLFDSAHFEVIAYADNGKMIVGCAATDGASHIVLDLKSMLNSGGPPTVARDGIGFTVTRIGPSGGSLVAHVDPHANFPYSDIHGYAKASRGPMMVIAPIEINQPATGAWRFLHTPDEKDVASGLRLVRLPRAAATLDARDDELTAGFGTLMLRMALRHPEKRAEVAKKLGVPVDWDLLAALDKRTSSDLRHLFAQPLAVNHIPATRPAN